MPRCRIAPGRHRSRLTPLIRRARIFKRHPPPRNRDKLTQAVSHGSNEKATMVAGVLDSHGDDYGMWAAGDGLRPGPFDGLRIRDRDDIPGSCDADTAVAEDACSLDRTTRADRGL